jgi:hypothetical protein
MALTQAAPIFLVLAALAAAPGALAQGGKKSGAPQARALVAYDTGSYDDHSVNELKGTAGDQRGVKLSGSDMQLAFNYKGFETEIWSRTLAPKSLPAWTKRSELSFTEAYYWDSFPWAQPTFGYFQMTQTGDETAPSAQPAFIDANRGLTFGLNVAAAPLDFGGHGVLLQARLDYLTSLEKKRNFGTERDLGLGYYIDQQGGLRWGLVLSQVRNFFNAAKPDPADSTYNLAVRHVYTLNRIGLYIEY